MDNDIVEVLPWERQPYENERMFLYFCTYRDMPYNAQHQKIRARTINAVLETVGLSPNSLADMYRYKKEYEWEERVTAYDAFMQKQLLDNRVSRIEDVRDAVVQEAMKRFDRANKMADMMMTILEAKVASGEVSPSDLKQLSSVVKDMFEIQSKMLGIPLHVKEKKSEEVEDAVFIIGAQVSRE